MFNHIGAHAYQQGELCRSIVMGGGGDAVPAARVWISRVRCRVWAVTLPHSLEEHWKKRNTTGLENYDPSRLDRPMTPSILLAEWGAAPNSERRIRLVRSGPMTKALGVTIAAPIATSGR